MNTPEIDPTSQTSRIINLSLRLLALGLLLVWCFQIVEPFIMLATWGTIIAVTLYPFHQRLTRVFKGRSALAASIIVVLLLLIMILPSMWFMVSSIGEAKELASQYREGTISIPPPTESVKTWPIIGNKLYGLWQQASSDFTKIITDNSESLKPYALKLFGVLGSTTKGLILLTGSIIISGVLLAYATSTVKVVKSLFVRLAGSKGDGIASIAEVTIRNVAKGILGVALIQSTLAGIGFIAVGLPAAGLWILICLILSVVQIGIMPISIGSIIYIWSYSDTLTATLFTVWMILVGVSDNILKPIMLGKGAPVPMLAVFVGAIGGFIHSGFIGLFTGAIVLSLGYKLFEGWLNEDAPPM